MTLAPRVTGVSTGRIHPPTNQACHEQRPCSGVTVIIETVPNPHMSSHCHFHKQAETTWWAGPTPPSDSCTSYQPFPRSTLGPEELFLRSHSVQPGTWSPAHRLDQMCPFLWTTSPSSGKMVVLALYIIQGRYYRDAFSSMAVPVPSVSMKHQGTLASPVLSWTAVDGRHVVKVATQEVRKTCRTS